MSDALEAAKQFGDKIFGGTLQKACFEVLEEPGGRVKPTTIDFYLNPKSIQIIKSVTLEEPKTEGNNTEVRWTVTNPIQLKLGEMWFDTYDSRESVRKKFIDKLETLLDYDEKTHHPPCIRLVWGDFTQETDKSEEYQFYVEKLTVDYQMFLPSGKPVRAKVQMELKQILELKAKAAAAAKQSPDHAKLYTVKRGDTLQGIAHEEYHDPREWRRIADTNELDDPMGITPGMKLLVPPILK